MREMHEKAMRQQRFAIGEAEESLIEREVEDALHATAEDRRAAALALAAAGGFLRVEVPPRAPGVPWERVASHRIEGSFRGVTTYFASLDDLIAMKEASGRREKDLPDLRRLRRLTEKLE